MRFILIFALLLVTPAMAQAGDNSAAGTRITLSASAETELPNDEVIMIYRVEKEGKDANTLRQQVNRITTAIQKRLQSEKGVKLKTTGRNMQPVWHYPKNQPRSRSGWRLTQSEQISSSNLDAVPEWLEAIEHEGALLSTLQFRVSNKSSLKAQESLRLQAIEAFRLKAASLANGLSAQSFRIISLNSSSQAPQPVLYRAEMAMMAKSTDTAPPSLSAGESSVKITVNGVIEVPFRDFKVK